MLSFKVAPEIEEKVSRIAEETGTSVEDLLNDMTTRMVEDFDAYRVFQEMAARGRGEVDKALELLQKPDINT